MIIFIWLLLKYQRNSMMDWMERLKWIFFCVHEMPFSSSNLFFIPCFLGCFGATLLPSWKYRAIIIIISASSSQRTRIKEQTEKISTAQHINNSQQCLPLLRSLLILISLTCCDNYSLFTINFSSTYNAFSWLTDCRLLMNHVKIIYMYQPMLKSRLGEKRWKKKKSQLYEVLCCSVFVSRQNSIERL